LQWFLAWMPSLTLSTLHKDSFQTCCVLRVWCVELSYCAAVIQAFTIMVARKARRKSRAGDFICSSSLRFATRSTQYSARFDCIVHTQGLIDQNQALLNAIGVGHTSLDKVSHVLQGKDSRVFIRQTGVRDCTITRDARQADRSWWRGLCMDTCASR
jgi:hypothetical protein